MLKLNTITGAELQPRLDQFKHQFAAVVGCLHIRFQNQIADPVGSVTSDFLSAMILSGCPKGCILSRLRPPAPVTRGCDRVNEHTRKQAALN